MKIKPKLDAGTRAFLWLGCWGAILGFAGLTIRADQVQMKNGDRYVGSVLSLNTNTVVLQSEVLGTVNLHRDQVTTITFGTGMPAAGASASVAASKGLQRAKTLPGTNEANDLSAALRELGTNNSALQQVQSQFLAGAGPQANNKFNELLGGLQSGKLNMTDLRAQAKMASDQILALKRDLGDDAGLAVDGYLEILDNFLKETATPVTTAPKPSVSLAKPKPAIEDREE